MEPMDLSRRWPLPDGAALRDELAAAYADPARGYHDSQHLTEVLDRLDELASAGVTYDTTPVVLAAWFHDAVYDGERDAEERSASWAEDALPALVPADVVAEVARLVRMTETHLPDDADANGCALSDADLGILAAPADRYAQYRAAIRQEYAHLPDEVFVPGRASVLRSLADKPHVFHTAFAQERWEGPARANMEHELAELEVGSLSG